MLLFRVALRNLLGTGLRLWINVLVISLSIVIIIFMQGILAGMDRQMYDATIKTEVGGGHIRSALFDPLEPMKKPQKFRYL
ncbi:hypothetical protein ACFL35_16385 [Candidatus Riflebacteria bacterium]